MDPFARDESLVPANKPSDEGIFTPPLAGFDFPAYEARQVRIDEVLRTRNPEALTELVTSFSNEDPEVGVKLNNLHNTILRGSLPKNLVAPLSVMTKSIVDVDVEGVNFKGGVAPGATFSKSLKGADLSDTILTEADFGGADLSGASLVNAVINRADFTNAKLFGANLTGAYLIGVTGLTPEQLKGINPTAARTIVGVGSEANTLERVLTSRFGDADDVKLLMQSLDPVPVAIDQTVPKLQSERLFRGLFGRNLNIGAVNFTGSNFTGADLEYLLGVQADFRGTTLGGVVIRNSILRESDFTGAWAPGIILEDVDLRGASLAKANLVGAILRAVDLRDVAGLEAEKTNLEGIVVEEGTQLPQGYGYNGIAIEASQKKTRELER